MEYALQSRPRPPQRFTAPPAFSSPASDAPGGRDARRSPVYDAVPQVRKRKAHFDQINVPANIGALLPAAATPGVFILRRIEIPNDTELLSAAYVGASWDLKPCNAGGATVDGVAAYSAGAAGSTLAWGRAAGQQTAAIGIGINVPLAPQTWGQVQVPYPNLEISPICNLSDETDGRWLELIGFPKGSFADGSESPASIGDSNTRLGWTELPSPCTVDICLIVRRAHLIIDNGTQHYLQGSGVIWTYFAETVPRY